MKTVFTLILVMGIVIQTYSQNTTANLDRLELIEKSEKQKKTGLIILGAGGGLALLGTVIAYTGGEGGGYIGLGFLTVGAVVTLTSIPILISSNSKAKKAAKISLVTNSTQVIVPIGSPPKYPALRISVPLNSTKR